MLVIKQTTTNHTPEIQNIKQEENIKLTILEDHKGATIFSTLASRKPANKARSKQLFHKLWRSMRHI